ncbi:hypothetical protein Ssi03_55480 [Sphaerisporangium siamense]|uniref:Ferredoxin n=1 Tax=Sphaerisporangium siamense TaxID=795645 RepID=A0A7W7GA17_9ACTN|nr:ferredoxin [Sphaerisporangium siamense]MBB4703448.1 ferredoxin [Sphaerisporangium siamense]GII87558.1 hypothetical protein Ssi03_55480 [Sphaerisporangium siamense]
MTGAVRTTRRLSVETDVCEGNAVCARMAPDLFVLPDDVEVVTVVRQPDTAELVRRAEMAVRRCPKRALRYDEVL